MEYLEEVKKRIEIQIHLHYIWYDDNVVEYLIMYGQGVISDITNVIPKVMSGKHYTMLQQSGIRYSQDRRKPLSTITVNSPNQLIY